MFNVSMPIALTPDEVWVFATTDDGDDPARLAVTTTGTFVALPADHFDNWGIFPTWPETGDPIPGLRWASAADIAEHPGVFAPH